MNGQDFTSKSLHTFHVGRLRLKLCKGRSSKAKESYSNNMKVSNDLDLCMAYCNSDDTKFDTILLKYIKN
jgi:PH domain of plant-specific actin-binding protein